MRTLYAEFSYFPKSIQDYMLKRDLDPLQNSSEKLFMFLNVSDDAYNDYLSFRKDLIQMCEGDKSLEIRVDGYLAKIFTFPAEVIFQEIKTKKKNKTKNECSRKS